MTGMPDITFATPRGVYPTLQSAQEAARKVPRGFVITNNPSRHVVYESRWTPHTHEHLAVDLEPSDHGDWTITITSPQVLRLDLHAARWLQQAALPAAINLLDRLATEHASRTGDLRWNDPPPRHRA